MCVNTFFGNHRCLWAWIPDSGIMLLLMLGHNREGMGAFQFFDAF